MTPIRKHAIALAILGAANLAGSAIAGCPGDKVVADGKGQKMVNFGPKDVTDVVIEATDLSTQKVALPGYQFRARRLTIKPGGIVPWHSHGERPANIFIVEGAITEYRSTCAVPIEHPAGDVTAEAGQLSHWWRNNTNKPAVLVSSDIVPTPMTDKEGGM